MSSSIPSTGLQCPVCLDLIDGREMIDLPRCGHKMHSSCFVELVEYQIKTSTSLLGSTSISLSCPICRGCVVNATSRSSIRTTIHDINNESVVVQLASSGTRHHVDLHGTTLTSHTPHTHAETCSLLTLLVAVVTLLYFVLQCVILNASSSALTPDP
jgi:hypothetical protein